MASFGSRNEGGPDLLEETLWLNAFAKASAKVWRALDDDSLPDVIAVFREIEQRIGLEQNWDC